MYKIDNKSVGMENSSTALTKIRPLIRCWNRGIYRSVYKYFYMFCVC